ncbi:NADH-quinone oxidoreductase subunit NuoG [Candidatus Paracaedibacter symbiosus]|uniref:NADH-quinone oxidoreductase subunit NuoG n=1 Tax=Candidatus Paracaedibacter symbiosus TaxID=244582 RepID=UPI00069184CE|nr:NADH-quinone oxidoreductase subunit NuoG [Candidatus Paracaedibacter symbiosus]
MPKLTINNIPVEVENGTTVLQACEQLGIEIPVFCYHPRLSIAGNCRMCLVEMEKSPKPIASCSMPAGEGMVIHTNSPLVEKARRGVLEFLLINHPLDCPICDQGGECDLQDLTLNYGPGQSRYELNKRAVTNKHMGPLIKTVMTRCIHCTRCVRFSNEIAGTAELGGFERGEHTEISTYLEGAILSELSGNLIDICPVGALTNKPYTFHGRPWELTKTNSIDVMDAVGCNIRIDTRGREVMRVLPRLNEDVNEEWISDKTRFSYDGLKRQRLDKPYIRKDGKLQPASWEEALAVVAEKLQATKPAEIAAIVGDQADCEAIIALKDVMTKLGVANLECRQDGTCHDATNRGSYLFNTTIAGIEQADAILLVGTNPRTEAVLVNARIRKRYLKGGLQIASIGPKVDLTYSYEYLGDQAPLLKELLEGSHPFAVKLEAAKNPMIIVGQGALNRRDGQEILRLCQSIADKFNMIQADWNGFNVLHTSAARVGALDLGFVPQNGGTDLHGILSGCQHGRIKVVYLLGADEIPASQFGDAFVIYQGHHGDAGAHRADVIFPGATYVEKTATYVNTEGRPQRTLQAATLPGDAKEDWRILRALGERLGFSLSYDDQEGMIRRLILENPIFAEMGKIYGAVWNLTRNKSHETLSHLPLKSTIDNFYMTDPISRHSSIMAECMLAQTEKKQTKVGGCSHA